MKNLVMYLFVAAIVIAVATPVSAGNLFGYNYRSSRGGFIGSWSGINPDKAYEDLSPEDRAGAAIALVSNAIQRDDASVRYANSQVTRANIENAQEVAKTIVFLRREFKGDKKRYYYPRW